MLETRVGNNMKLKYENSIFNMGDTSFRCKRICEVNFEILKALDQFAQEGKTWVEDKNNQQKFYDGLIHSFALLRENDSGIDDFPDFNRDCSDPKPNEIGLRGRTCTNQIKKIGFVDENRVISEVGRDYLDGVVTNLDSLELAVFGELSQTNISSIVYFRQLLKLRVYNQDGKRFIYPFRIFLKLLQKYGEIEESNIFDIVMAFSSCFEEQKINEIIDGYEDVKKSNIDFLTYANKYFLKCKNAKDVKEDLKEIIELHNFSEEKIADVFRNGKSQDNSIHEYKDFLVSLVNFRENKSLDNLENLINFSNTDKIKKAFGKNKVIFSLTTKERKNNKDLVNFFLQKYADSELLQDDYSLIYKCFNESKLYDLTYEYKDMCERTFRLSGVYECKNGLCNFTNDTFSKPLISILLKNIQLCGEDSFNFYENSLNSIFYKDVTTLEILPIEHSIVESEIIKICKEKGISIDDFGSFKEVDSNIKEDELRAKIKSMFSRDKVIKVLELIGRREKEGQPVNDKVLKLVTDNASVPTIYEYLITIAWFYIANESKNLRLSNMFKVGLDANKLPIIHNGPGSGDIEVIKKDEYSLLIEATLMNKSSQKRGELEPVIRHSINFKIQEKGNKVITIFVANEIDSNVKNIFRGSKYIEFSGTENKNSSKKVNGLDIYTLTTDNIIELLKNSSKTDDVHIMKIYDNDIRCSREPCVVKSDWEDEIVRSILQG